MHNEQFPFVPEEEGRLHMDRLHVRREAKNLMDWVRQSPELPNRGAILEALEGILALLPPRNREEEEYEEHQRMLDRGGP